jgi:phospholipid/cholesterol/gamma-HCH transport system ATP-binding protein
MEPIIEIANLHKSFNGNEVLKGLNITINKGEDAVILGRSGGGKSVTIKCLVGLEKVDKGKIKVFGTDITKISNEELNQIRSRLGFMFQNGALYDSMTVRQNLAFALKHHDRNLPKETVEAKINEALEDVGLLDSIEKMPADLSGGMRKRIGMARTLIVNPEVILYDEPTAGLDTITGREIIELMKEVQKKEKTTSLIITHDMHCVKLFGKRILVLKEGVIIAEGTYEELEKSKDSWIRSFFI